MLAYVLDIIFSPSNTPDRKQILILVSKRVESSYESSDICCLRTLPIINWTAKHHKRNALRSEALQNGGYTLLRSISIVKTSRVDVPDDAVASLNYCLCFRLSRRVVTLDEHPCRFMTLLGATT